MTFFSPSRAAITVAAIAALLAASGCGQRGSLIPKTNAQALLLKLDVIEQQMASGACDQLPSSIGDAQAQVNALPSSVDPELRSRIEEGIANLTTQAPRDCAAGTLTTTTTTTTATTPTVTTATQTTPTATTPTQTVVPTTTTPVPTTTTPVPTTPTVTATPPTGGAGTGGSGGTGGASPDTGGTSP